MIQSGQGEAAGLDKRVLVTTWKSFGRQIQLVAHHLPSSQLQAAAVDEVALVGLPKVKGHLMVFLRQLAAESSEPLGQSRPN